MTSLASQDISRIIEMVWEDRMPFEVIHFESWSKSLTNGKVNLLNKPRIDLQKKYCMTDYINFVARKISTLAFLK